MAAVSADGKMYVQEANHLQLFFSWSWEFTPSSVNRPSKWVLRGLLESTNSTVTSMHVSPYANEVAVGTSTGTLLVYDVLTCTLKVKHDMFNSPVRGIRWCGPTQLICFSSKQYVFFNNFFNILCRVGASAYINQLVSVNLLSGQHTYIRKDKEKDESYIRGIRISDTMRYLIVLPKERPVEVWQLEPSPKAIRILPLGNVTALEWCPTRVLPNQKPDEKAKEHFFLTTSDGSLHFYRVEGNQVFEDRKQPKIFPNNQVSALAWKDNFLVSGDTVGNLNLFEISNKKSKSIATHRGLVRRIQFSPVDHTIIVLFADGDFSVWDLDQGIKVSQSSTHIKAECVDWIGNNPIIATSTGSLIVYDAALQVSNSSIVNRALQEPVQTPTFLPNAQAQFMRSMMDNKLLFKDSLDDLVLTSSTKEQKLYRNYLGELVSEEMKMNPMDDQIRGHKVLVPVELKNRLENSTLTTPDRCLLISQYFGDRTAVRFWKLAIKFLTQYKNQSNAENTPIVDPSQVKNILKSEQPSTHAFDLDEGLDFVDTLDATAQRASMPAVFDLLRDNESVRLDEMAIIKTHDESIRLNNTPQAADMYQQVAQSEALLGQKNTAVKLLMKTPNNHPDMYLNFLHACVIAASNSQAHFRETVQLVASSLISQKSEKDLMYAVEFLALIGEGYKACKILQDFDMWEKSARLAKCILPESQSKAIMAKWANQLATSGKQMKAIGMYCWFTWLLILL